MGCSTCGGEVIPNITVDQKVLTTLPTVNEQDTLYIEYIVPGVSSLRLTGVTGTNYYFTGSPRNKRKLLVVQDMDFDPNVAVHVNDAAEFIKIANAEYRSFQWVVVEGTPPPVQEVVENVVQEVTQEVVQEGLPDINMSISNMKEVLAKGTYDVATLIEQEKAGKNREGMLSLLHANL